jgi:hypothetical protein
MLSHGGVELATQVTGLLMVRVGLLSAIQPARTIAPEPLAAAKLASPAEREIAGL